MPRSGSSAMLAAIAAGVLTPQIFVELNFQSGSEYLWTGIGSTTWNGNTWLGAGDILSFGQVEEGFTPDTARGIPLVLSGFNPTTLANVMAQYQLGLPAAIYLGLASGGSLLASPFVAWYGRMGQPSIAVSDSKGSITINLESRFIDMNNAVDRRLTDQDQQMTWPQDTGMSFVSGIQFITTFWGGFPNAGKNI